MNKELFIAAGKRAVKTMIQTVLSMITIGQAIEDISWLSIGSVTLVAGMISFLQNIITIPPEVE